MLGLGLSSAEQRSSTLGPRRDEQALCSAQFGLLRDSNIYAGCKSYLTDSVVRSGDVTGERLEINYLTGDSLRVN